jgi:integrase
MRLLLSDIDKGVPIITEQQTVEQFLLWWLDAIKPTVDYSTYTFYEVYVRCHIIPALGRFQLAKLTPQQVQGLYSAKIQDGYASTSAKHLHATLHVALDRACQLGLVVRNICDLVEVPKVADFEYTTLSQQEAQHFLQVVEGDRLHALYVLALTTGMRQGEILGLNWKDVDFDHGVVRIRRTLRAIRGKFQFADPKTASARRQITLSQIALDVLKQHRVRQNKERLALGSAWDTSLDLVFPNQLGRPISSTNLVKRSFHPFLKKAGLPDIRFHDLRHTCATLLLRANVNVKIVSEMLGHSDIGVTLRIYSHVIPDMTAQVAYAMDGIFTLTEEQKMQVSS